MRSREMMQQRTILASTAEEWDAKINEVLASLPEGKAEPHVIRERTEDGFMAVVEYIVYVREPEDIYDEFALRGIHYHCEDCPHLSKSEDKRVKWHECDLGMKELTKESSMACEWYLEQIVKAGGLK